MDIPAGTILKYKEHPPLEILSREPWFKNPVALCVVLGKYFHHQDRAKHYEHFGTTHEANLWLREQHIITKDDALSHPETLTVGDGLASLVIAAEKVDATKAYIRSINIGSTPLIVPGDTTYRQQIVATIYAAFYR